MLINDQLHTKLHTSQLIVILHIFIIDIVLFARVIIKLIKYILQFFTSTYLEITLKSSVLMGCAAGDAKST